LARDVKAKISNKQYILITLLEAPILAVILGYFTKYISGSDDDARAYIFSNNENIPSFIFMAVVVSLFLGLIISAEEILHDRRIMKRESFLNLSRFSYLNSKVIVMLVISAIQTLLFVLIANTILEIKGLTLEYWLVLYTASTCANMIGLNLSAALNTVVAVYVSIPFILVPQLLFSGVIVNFTKLHPAITSQKHVPFVGDLMTSRWAYEALVVEQFRNNDFETQFFEYEQKMSEASFRSSFYIPEIKQRYQNWLRTGNEKQLKLLQNEFPKIADSYSLPEGLEFTKNGLANSSVGLLQWIEKIKQNGWLDYKKESDKRDQVYTNLLDQYGGKKELFDYKQKHHNEAIEQIVLNRREPNKIVEFKGELIQLKDPIFQNPQNKFGRAQLFASQKRIGNFYIDTFWFNVVIIWLTSLFFYFTLYFDVIRRFLLMIEILWITILPEGHIRIRRKRQS
jgi:hypothetical protein